MQNQGIIISPAREAVVAPRSDSVARELPPLPLVPVEIHRI